MRWPSSQFVWNAYFLFKLHLYAKGSIAHDVLLSLALLAFVTAPLPERLARLRALTLARQTLNAALAALLLWHDSYLPAPLQAWAQLQHQGMPSAAYIVSFLLGYFDGPLIAVIAGALMATFLVRRWHVVTAAFVTALLLTAPWGVAWTAPQATLVPASAAQKPTDPATQLEEFYGREAERVVLFKKASNPAFDIIVMHVCSMAWSDLRAVGLDQHAFFKGMNYVFTGFNSASSYSNPAVTRLLRANCGQTTHTALYDSAPPTCFLFESLKGVGFQNYVVMSHDGKYGHYTEDIKKNGLADATYLFPEKMKPQSIFFDDSKMYSDFDMLQRWLETRDASSAPRAALYFNSVNLHAGSHWVDEKKWWARDPKEQYEDFASFLLHGLDKFLSELAKTKRNYVVVFVPEHGRALKSTPMQGKDLRDIPLPGITHVPLAIKLIGPDFKAPAQVVVDKPTSYLALSWLLARFSEKSPFGPEAGAPSDLVRRLPTTEFVADHSGTTIIERGGEYFMNQTGKSKEWLKLMPSQLGE